VVVVLAIMGAAASASAQTGAPLALAELERLALQNNPTARAAQAAVDAARARARQAGAWPNPIVGYAGEELGGGRSEEPRGAHGIFAEQTVVLGGKLGLARNVFERDADVAQAAVDLQRQRILSSVRTLFYRALAAERRVEVTERLAALVSEAVGVTAQLFNVGAADRPDYLVTEIEARRVQLELSEARNDVFAVRQQMAAVAGTLDIASRPLAGSFDQAIPELDRETVLRVLVEQSPQTSAARVEVERARAVTARARRETYPNLFLRGGSAYSRERGETTGRAIGWEAAVEAGFSIPLFNRNQGGIAAARADETRAEAELRRVELALRADAAAQFSTYLTSLRKAEVYRDEILPRAEEAYRLYLTRYREMAAAYPQVLVAQRTLFDMSREYLQTLDRAWRSAVGLQGLLAGSALESPGAGGGGNVPNQSEEREP
jgi:cobalt-zinc-cadmium efflux system outer membrane protein